MLNKDYNWWLDEDNYFASMARGERILNQRIENHRLRATKKMFTKDGINYIPSDRADGYVYRAYGSVDKLLKLSNRSALSSTPEHYQDFGEVRCYVKAA